MARRYQVLIFDWDGTLTDSMHDIVLSLQQAASEFAITLAYEQVREIIGLSSDVIMQRLFSALDLQQQQQLQQRYQALYYARVERKDLLFPGVKQVLTQLVKQNYCLAVATGKSRQGLDKALAQTGMAHFFPYTRCADETFSKPHPLMIEQILDFFALPASQALMIGDTVHDMQLAANAGIDACAVGYGVHNKHELLAYQPVTCLDSIMALATYLDASNV